MNISSINSAAAAGTDNVNQTDFRSRMEQAMGPVANLFGMTSDQLMTAVQQSGGTLSDYAASKGISSTDLTAAIKQGLQQNAPNGVQLSDSQLTNMANRIANHKPHGHHGHHGGGGGQTVDDTSATSATSSTSTIKTDLDQLIADLQSAQAAQSAQSGTTSTSTDPTAAAPGSNGAPSADALLDMLTKFDAQL